MPSIEYYTSERFIHDGLCRDVVGGFKAVRREWMQKGSIPAFCLIWPGEAFTDDDGIQREGPVEVELPDNPAEWREWLRQSIRRVNGYAVFLCKQRERDVHAILESRHGTRTWILPIEDFGDHKALGKASFSDDSDLLGLLWQPKGQG